MPPRLRRRVDAFRTMTIPSELHAARASVDLDTLAAVAVACRNHERIGFGDTGRDQVASDRDVEPHRIVLVGARWYLVAFDTDRHDWRTFRIDRLRDLTERGRRFAPRELPGGDAAAFVEAGITSAPALRVIDVVVDAPAGDVEARIGRWCTVEPVSAARCRVTIRAESDEWAAFALGTLGAGFTVEGPPGFRAVLLDWSRRFATAAA